MSEALHAEVTAHLCAPSPIGHDWHGPTDQLSVDRLVELHGEEHRYDRFNLGHNAHSCDDLARWTREMAARIGGAA